LTELGKQELYPQACDKMEEIAPIPSKGVSSNQFRSAKRVKSEK